MNLADAVRGANRRARGLMPILAVDLTVYTALLLVYFGLRFAAPVWPRPFHFPSGLMTVSMAMFAFSSSFVLHVALKSQAIADAVMVRRMIALALVGWATFLFLLAMEWGRLYFFEGVKLLGNPWHVPALGITYYVLTAYVAAHMIAGTVYLIQVFREPAGPGLFGLTLFVDFTNALFVAVAFLVILSATDLGGF